MKACENPKCPFHFEVPDDVIRSGWLNFRPLELIQCTPIPRDCSTTAAIRRGEIRLHQYRTNFNQRVSLCDVCNEASQMFSR